MKTAGQQIIPSELPEGTSPAYTLPLVQWNWFWTSGFRTVKKKKKTDLCGFKPIICSSSYSKLILPQNVAGVCLCLPCCGKVMKSQSRGLIGDVYKIYYNICILENLYCNKEKGADRK